MASLTLGLSFKLLDDWKIKIIINIRIYIYSNDSLDTHILNSLSFHMILNDFLFIFFILMMEGMRLITNQVALCCHIILRLDGNHFLILQ